MNAHNFSIGATANQNVLRNQTPLTLDALSIMLLARLRQRRMSHGPSATRTFLPAKSLLA